MDGRQRKAVIIEKKPTTITTLFVASRADRFKVLKRVISTHYQKKLGG